MTYIGYRYILLWCMYVDNSVCSNFIESNQMFQNVVKSLTCNGSRSGKSLYYCTKFSVHLNVKLWVFFRILLHFLGERSLIQIMVSLWNVDRWVTVSADIEMLPIYKHVSCRIHRKKLTTYIHDVLSELSYKRHILWLKMYIV